MCIVPLCDVRGLCGLIKSGFLEPDARGGGRLWEEDASGLTELLSCCVLSASLAFPSACIMRGLMRIAAHGRICPFSARRVCSTFPPAPALGLVDPV